MLEMWWNFLSGSHEPMPRKTSDMQYLQENRTLRKNVSIKNPPLPARKPMQRGPYQRPQGQNSQLKVRQIQERLITEEKQEDEEVESVDPEAALYIKELSEDWADINHIAPEIFSEVKKTQLNTSLTKEIWVETVTANNLKIQWLVDTGSPRTFVSKEQANTIMANNPKIQLQPYKSPTKYKSFNNNNNIKIEGELSLTLCSGPWTEEHCRILVVGHKTNNLMGRDVLQKLGITLQQQQCKSPGNKIHAINSIETEKNIIKWIYNKYPHLCTRLGKSKNHIAKSIFKRNQNPIQQKGRRIPLHLLEKVEMELDKLIQAKQITKLEKCPNDLFASTVVITVKKDKSVKITLDSKNLNKAIQKNKYQMQSIDHLVDAVALYITQRENPPGTFGSQKYTSSMRTIKYPLTNQYQSTVTLASLEAGQQELTDF